jgi:hypothetical protein
MNTFTPYIPGASCILKRGDRADHRMTELNELIASAKGSTVKPLTETFFVSYNTHQRRKKFKVKKRGGPKPALATIQAGVVAFKKKRRK